MEKIDPNFIREVTRRSGTLHSRCYNCLACTSGCQFAHIMDRKPHEMIRLAQLGLKNEALSASAPWLCVGCNTCSMECPNGINIPAVMDAMRELAIIRGKIPEPDIYNFHKEILGSVKRYGRTHKLEIMMRYKLVTRDFFSDMDLGLRMLSRRKLHILPSRIRHLRDIRTLFKKAG
ncbi:MAG: 4Fe-4S dicluster domain-containing protein [Desulfobacterales bacterium]|nr:4Fe-4S dicluster domain-containing protein [Desulfobacterales bacterium]